MKLNLTNEIVLGMMTLLLYRLGGQQTFSPEEIQEIKGTVGGVSVFIDPSGRVILKCRSAELMPPINHEVPE